jgi:hypothetical protein
MPLNKMCTSIAVGFYIKDKEDYFSFKEKMYELSKSDHCIVSVAEKKPQALNFSQTKTEQKVVL